MTAHITTLQLQLQLFLTASQQPVSLLLPPSFPPLYHCTTSSIVYIVYLPANLHLLGEKNSCCEYHLACKVSVTPIIHENCENVPPNLLALATLNYFFCSYIIIVIKQWKSWWTDISVAESLPGPRSKQLLNQRRTSHQECDVTYLSQILSISAASDGALAPCGIPSWESRHMVVL